MMNAEAARLGLAHTHYSTPIGLDTPGNYSSAGDLVKLARYALRTSRSSRHVVAMPTATLWTGPSARRQPQRPGRPRSVDQRGQDRSHAGRRIRAGRSGTRDGMTLISAVLGTPQRVRARREHDGAAQLGVRQLPLARR